MKKKILISRKIYEDLIPYKTGTNQKTYIDSNNPNEITKRPKRGETFEKDDLIKFEFMNKFPNIFIKTYDITPYQVKQEKIDDNSFVNHLTKLKNELKSEGYLKNWDFELGEKTELNFLIDDIRISEENLLKLVDNVSSKSFSLYKKIKIFLDKLDKVEEDSPFSFDIHAFQLGYDKKGEIKCFDI